MLVVLGALVGEILKLERKGLRGSHILFVEGLVVRILEGAALDLVDVDFVGRDAGNG